MRRAIEREPVLFTQFDSIRAQVGHEQIDGYGHANYRNGHEALLDIGRQAFLESRGMSYDELWEKYGLKSFIYEHYVKTSDQLFLGDMIDIDTSAQILGARVIFN